MKRSRESGEESDSQISSPDTHTDSAAASPRQLSSPPDSHPRAKLTGLDPSAISDNEDEVVMRCHFPPHREALAFRTYDAYETHYNKAHTNRCMECARNFPSDHFLILHIEECHDPLVEIRREKGDHTFSCFVEDCGRKCRTPQKRRLHLIDKHMFPKNYFFAVTKAGIDGRRSLLTDGHARRRSSTAGTVKRIRARRRASSDGTVEGVQPERQSDAATDEMAKEDVVLEDAVTADPSSPGVGKPTGEEVSEEPEGKPDTEMEALAGAMSSLRFVPASICFGRRKGKTGFSAT